MHHITSTLLLCGDTITDAGMLERTFSTFHASNILLQQQYRAKGFTKYCDLISCLLVAEQNEMKLLMKNHETRPTGVAPLPEANMVTYNDYSGGRDRGYGVGRGYGRGRGQGRGFGRGNYYCGNHVFSLRTQGATRSSIIRKRMREDGEKKKKANAIHDIR
ncbi:hypothetical protein Tco_0780001 [Tanacetum coccineum]